MKRILLAVIFGLAAIGVLIGLGVWQMNRLAEKEAQIAAIENRISDTPIALPDFPDLAADKYAPVQLTGRIGQGELFVLVSTKQAGAGYRVIAPFQTVDGRNILLDRGFIPVAARDTPRTTGAAEVRGNLHWPDDRNSSTPENDIAGNIWFARDIPAMAKALKTEPVLVIARRETPGDPGITVMPVDTSHIPNDHLQYAITWFSLAAIWLAMSGYYIWRNTRQKDV